MGFRPSTVTAVRADVWAAAEGLKGQNYPRQNATNITQLSDGVVYFIGVPFLAGDIVSTLYLDVQAAAVGPTVSLMGLCNATSRLAISADAGNDWTNTGVRSCALGTAYTVTTNGLLYIAVISKANTTTVTAARANNQANTLAVIGTGARSVGTQSGQTTIPASPTMTDTNPVAVWVGWS